MRLSKSFTKRLASSPLKEIGSLDNIFIERWFRSLKHEDLYLKDYQNVLELQVGIKHYVQFYNQRRYHQALNYKTPNQVFYADCNTFSGQGVNVA
ncbi:hypothetical protein COW36_21585 [bacterium (Candidatus Blackallbacteria) CG17_big_fil_post_rev_8_21_14_2_50_48_46]|uniref:Integrase catalytic domain-containing protein n=1 Tax=bacterium (Candidatus Blackallbacteria) CG17_big_fil_post_rev_8_21_14_2_50_48_46 TaxID=2014261 RepID=A0A2M7FZC8_9BACT|nr:MAG: hypothetical protein COW64_14885 [bacterium (Candidatus Blackallbacteria) CG18_big_fil_WC_8_21_14_2_50_49_26]PIW14632.1 MAG: hypothetical protein COW36_21585 [bacterium (Candidatus Blackallbacteria) CG17_big_fil_post_rev_8_21_14_2_50_48_46]PIW45683.1 MAG: hypothetical protein COW20_19415 [bacterium (Candidatus Blackallbacteria) CG13_big_fil_rev_8_21_14_2_50_49_14]